VSAGLRAAARALGSRAGRSYVVGSDVTDLERSHAMAAQRGYAVDLCYWPRPGASPATVADGYRGAVEAGGARGGAVRLAVKASQLGFDSSALGPVLATCRRAAVPVIFDALEVGESDGVLGMVDDARGAGVELGCALAGRWPRSSSDLEWVLERGLRVRVVKGQYPDPQHLDADPRAGFLSLIDRLAGRAPFVSVATHERALAREAIRRLRAGGTPCELELLYGFPLRRSVRDARVLGVPVRLYLPYGHGRTPYPPRSALREPRTARFLLGDVLIGSARARMPLPPGKVGSGPC
jgi:proline dehydrogenase